MFCLVLKKTMTVSYKSLFCSTPILLILCLIIITTTTITLSFPRRRRPLVVLLSSLFISTLLFSTTMPISMIVKDKIFDCCKDYYFTAKIKGIWNYFTHFIHFHNVAKIKCLLARKCQSEVSAFRFNGNACQEVSYRTIYEREYQIIAHL